MFAIQNIFKSCITLFRSGKGDIVTRKKCGTMGNQSKNAARLRRAVEIKFRVR